MMNINKYKLPIAAIILLVTAFITLGQEPTDPKLLEKYNQAESLWEEATLLRKKGTAESLWAALEKYASAQKLYRETGSKSYEAICFSLLGFINNSLGEKQKALEYYNQALPLLRQVGDKSGEATTLSNIGSVYSSLGEKQKALEYYNLSLEISNELKDKGSEVGLLNNLGEVYRYSSEYEIALKYYFQALSNVQKIEDIRSEKIMEAGLLSNIGLSYCSLASVNKNSELTTKGLEFLNRSLLISRETKDNLGEATTLNHIGLAYFDLNEQNKGLKTLNQSLLLLQRIGEKQKEAKTLDNLMWVWNRLNNSNLAIFYGKQSVNLYQELRQNIQGLDKETQKTYLKSVEDTYRHLANILIAQGRIAEAEQVLAMLKEEETFSYLRRDDKVAADLKTRISLSEDEKKAFAEYEKYADEMTLAAQEFEALKKKIPIGETAESLSAAERVKYKELENKYNAAVTVFNKFLDDLKIRFAQNKNQSEIVAQVESVTQSLLREANEPRTVIISTIVGEDRLNLIVTTADIQRAHTVEVKAEEINKLVAEFRQALTNPSIDPRPFGKDLYDKLFPKALQTDLANIKADTIIWSLDGTLRYVPMAALWDGEKYLAERYRQAVITLASINKTAPTSRQNWKAFGVGVSKEFENFKELPAVPKELCSIVKDAKQKEYCDQLGEKGVFDGVMLRDEDFTLDRFQPSFGKMPLVHIASHFALNPGDYKDSYLLLGGGANRRFSLENLRTTRLDGIELLTLSACNTAMTAGNKTNGLEVEGFGALAQKQGVKSVLATLWAVADESTGMLMTEFYKILETNPNIGKAEAMQMAQKAMISGKLKSSGNDSGCRNSEKVNLGGKTQTEFKCNPNAPFSHPYYWSPFILIGNWR